MNLIPDPRPGQAVDTPLGPGRVMRYVAPLAVVLTAQGEAVFDAHELTPRQPAPHAEPRPRAAHLRRGRLAKRPDHLRPVR